MVDTNPGAATWPLAPEGKARARGRARGHSLGSAAPLLSCMEEEWPRTQTESAGGTHHHPSQQPPQEHPPPNPPSPCLLPQCASARPSTIEPWLTWARATGGLLGLRLTDSWGWEFSGAVPFTPVVGSFLWLHRIAVFQAAGIDG